MCSLSQLQTLSNSSLIQIAKYCGYSPYCLAEFWVQPEDPEFDRWTVSVRLPALFLGPKKYPPPPRLPLRLLNTPCDCDRILDLLATGLCTWSRASFNARFARPLRRLGQSRLEHMPSFTDDDAGPGSEVAGRLLPLPLRRRLCIYKNKLPSRHFSLISINRPLLVPLSIRARPDCDVGIFQTQLSFSRTCT